MATERLETDDRPQGLLLAAWGLTLIATLGSLRYSGIGFLGLEGLGLPPCELCWYQRILMYPLTGILGVAAWRMDRRFIQYGFWTAVVGMVFAAYHSLIQWLPHLEAGECVVGSCTATLYKVAGLSIPNQSFIAFTGIVVLLGAVRFVEHLQSDPSRMDTDEEE